MYGKSRQAIDEFTEDAKRCRSVQHRHAERALRRTERRGQSFFQRKVPELADLYEEPFTSFRHNAVEKLFSKSELAA
jgi:hypothetical protein